MEYGIAGRVAIVSGGSRGIGRAIARTLASEGASVVIAARTQSHLDDAATELEACFDLAYHFKHVDTIFRRVFGAS